MLTTIHIACNINATYIQHCAVMLVSLCENNPNTYFHIHILSDDISQTDIDTLHDTVRKYRIHLIFYIENDDLLVKCPIAAQSHIARTTYYRCFLSSILPSEIDKILYLDCDLIIRGNIEELWNININQYAIACVQDMWSSKPQNYSRLKYEPEYSYFNAGVLLVNMSYWREHDIAGQAIQYITTYPERLLFNDQDVLNALLHDKKLFLPYRWNMQDGFFRRKRKISSNAWSELDKAIEDPTILHYTGSKKPWHYKSQHPYKREYFKYLDRTPWASWCPNIDYNFLIIKTLNEILYSLRILQPKYRKIKKQE